MKRKRYAPMPEEIKAKRQDVRKSLGVNENARSTDYDPLRPDKKAIPKPAAEENMMISKIIMEKMEECFPPEKRSVDLNGNLRIPLIIVDQKASTNAV